MLGSQWPLLGAMCLQGRSSDSVDTNCKLAMLARCQACMTDMDQITTAHCSTRWHCWLQAQLLPIDSQIMGAGAGEVDGLGGLPIPGWRVRRIAVAASSLCACSSLLIPFGFGGRATRCSRAEITAPIQRRRSKMIRTSYM